MENQYGTETRLSPDEVLKKDFFKKEVVEILCEKCGKHVCYVASQDLDGNIFLCDECYKKVVVK